ncbi:GAF domain-containing protein [Acrocarpospora corrugata]|uniref:GAF domain-containing protein n=1 Tax=Acrocarpospora corrugata TaxID=35763 RepID=A0A5M3W5A6_9ACTN|nr:GAF and ANTAR domain-containing protein [Acrocarpospora corrugata]GES04247.1 GAF domain-containing protein [Acrocarpospora corrugata]
MAVNGGNRTARAAKAWALIIGCAGGAPVAAEHVCRAVRAAVGVDGAALSLSTGMDSQSLVYATDEVARRVAELHFSLGEGPAVEAWTFGGASLAPDLDSATASARWPWFAPAAVQAGACAVFAFPLQAGAIRLGTLDLYQAKPGPLSAEQLADALTFAAASLGVMLHAAHPAAGPPEDVRPFDAMEEPRAEVYQAIGMIAVQLGVGLAEAFVRLRAHAFAEGVGVDQIARLVVGRNLRFDPDDPAGTPGAHAEPDL